METGSALTYYYEVKYGPKYEIYYVDSWSALIDEDGVLYADYAGNSGYTMNESGYRKMLEYIRFHAHPSFGASEEVMGEE